VTIELVIFVGLQGAGKSSFFRERFAGSHTLVSKDLMPSVRDRNERQRRLIFESLTRGASVVVDNTNVTALDRARLIAVARETGARAVAYVFIPDVQGSLQRNRQREGKARVPDAVIFATMARFQAPTSEEGFDELHSVRVRNDQFVVEDVDGGQAQDR
jgi:predicted kinase